MANNNKNVYFFAQGDTEGDASMKNTLGGKGANLAEMTSLGVPVPPGFTIATDVCHMFYELEKKLPESLTNEVHSALAKVETLMDKKFGDSENPLLVSVRSGARALSLIHI